MRHRHPLICLPSRRARVFAGGLLCAVQSLAWSQGVATDTEIAGSSEEATETAPDEWIDRAHEGVHGVVWRSARWIDGLFGEQLDEEVYRQQTRGSITPAVLWDEFGGWDSKFRFRVNLPLPRLDQRYNAFVGTFSRDEFVTERDIQSGAIQRQHAGGQVEQDQTLVGLQFRPPKDGGRWDAAAGLRIRSPVDPFVRVSYRWQRGSTDRLLFRWRETGFWEASEQFGLTSRVDLERYVGDEWLARWTLSGTFSEKSDGVRGYTALTVLALLTAGQTYQDPRLRDAVDFLADFGMEGTYAVSLRAGVWARLPRKYATNLSKDTQWLLDGFSDQAGGWDYVQDPRTGYRDNSIRQFGALALWEAAKRGLAKAIVQSDFVIANPTHISVALRYRVAEGAPVVTAKGYDEVALYIRKLAKENDVPVIENKPLARALAKRVKPGRPVPVDLYAAVAEILAFVYRLKKRSIDSLTRQAAPRRARRAAAPAPKMPS